MLIIPLAGPELTERESEALGHPAVSGVILFGRNFRDRRQLRALTGQIREAASGPILITVDQEGGRVQRFREGFTRLPAAARYGELYRQDPQLGLLWAERGGYLMALELREVGVDLSFAPVLDVDRGKSRVIGDRAFGSEPDRVAALASAFRRGMGRAGMAAVGKHFPGHGHVAEDSHLELPVDRRPLREIGRHDLLPYRRLIAEGLEAVMTAHLLYPEVDPKPATFSPRWLRGVLRHELRFRGVVFSDDLAMAGAEAARSLPERIRAAKRAGCDFLIVSTQEIFAHLDRLQTEADRLKIERLLGRRPQPITPSERERWRQALERIAHGRSPET